MIGLTSLKIFICVFIRRGCFQGQSLKIHFQFGQMFYFVLYSFEVLIVPKWLGEFLELPKEEGLGEYKIHLHFQ